MKPTKSGAPPGVSSAPRRVLLKILLSIVLFVALSEIGLRWVLGEARVSRTSPPAAYFAALGAYETDRPLPPRPLGPKSGFRIVVAGDSTAVGFPYSLVLGAAGQRLTQDAAPQLAPTYLSFGRFLAEGLQAATGIPIDLQGFTIQGRASVGVLADLDATLAARPDLLIVYVGHNELAWRLTRVSPFGRARRGAVDRLFPGWHDLLRRARARGRAVSLGGLPPIFSKELRAGAELLEHGDAERLGPENLPLEPREVALHLDRYEANLRTLVARAREARVRLVLVEPTSNLLTPPVASGRGWDERAQRAWEAGWAARVGNPRLARARLVEARDLDPAPSRLTSEGLERLRRAAGDTPRVTLDDGGLEDRFADLMHPTVELAAVFAERIAAALPFEDAPRLPPGDAAARERFRAAIRAHLGRRADLDEVIALGDAIAVALGAYARLLHGNRGAAEAEVRAVPEERRDFRMTLLMDVALRWRGARGEANDLLSRSVARHPDWAPALTWWRERADR